MVGQFKDDRIQDHSHYLPINQGGQQSQWIWKIMLQEGYVQEYWAIASTIFFDARHGETTRTKQKGVKFIIKVL